VKNLFILHLLFSFGISQRVQLFTKTDDIFTSANHFTIKNKRVIFWEDKMVLMTVPVKNLVEVRYAEKSYAYVGTPCVFIGSFAMASTVGLAVAGQINTALHRIEIPVFEWNGLQLIRLSVQIYNQQNDIDSLMSALPSLI